MKRRYVTELADGDLYDDVLLVREKQVRTNRLGNMYLFLDLSDRTGAITSRYWNCTEEDGKLFEPGDFLHVKGKVQLFQNQLQLIINGFKKVTLSEGEIEEFLPRTKKDIDRLLKELRTSLSKIRDPHMQALARAFLMDDGFIQELVRAPAGVRNHHAYIGGLLEHIVNILVTYDRIADLYPELNPDLMRMGIFLHDLGKIRELRYDRDFGYSDAGQLVGHLVLGIEMLNDKLYMVKELLGSPIPEELVHELKHLILSHHGEPEFGSPKLPMTVEAIALHHLDNLDSKVHSFSVAIKEDVNIDSPWTSYDPKMRRRFYKGSRSEEAT